MIGLIFVCILAAVVGTVTDVAHAGNTSVYCVILHVKLCYIHEALLTF
jgi:hypothetical protein